MKKNITRLIILLSVMNITGCYNAPDKLKPAPWVFDMMPKDAPNNFKKGWKDGCESGLGNMTNSYYKSFYSFKMDPKLRNDATYYKAWKDTYTFCRHYIYGTLRESNQRMHLPNRRPEIQETFMGAQGIFEAGLLNMWGPGDWLLPFQKIGPVAGNTDLPSLGGGAPWSEVISGQGTIDFSDGYMPLGFENGMNMDYGTPAFFGTTTADRPTYVPQTYKP